MVSIKNLSLSELIETGIDNKLNDLHTAMAGVVESYNPGTQTARIRLATKRVARDYDTGEVITEKYPILEDVPVAIIGGGGISLSVPLAKGDSVLVIFIEDDVSNYRSNGKPDSDPITLDRHTLSSAVCLPCRLPTSKYTAVSDVITIGSGPLADFVALASLVNDNLASLKDYIASHTHPVASAVAGKTEDPAPSLGDVSCTKLKVE